jgi:hypothetical protein
MSDDRFVSFFRMSRSAFLTLQLEIQHDPIFQNNSPNSQAHPALQLACALFQFGQLGNSTVRVAEQLEIGEGTTRVYLYRSMVALLRLIPKYLVWPEKHSKSYRDMRRGIKQSTGFPGCVGFIDGCDINLLHAPSFHGETYLNRKKNYAINLQGICDFKCKFTYVSTGYPASVGDPAVFASTNLFQKPHQFFSKPDEYILGDKIYRVTRRCMTPYKDPQGQQREGGYKYFNRIHAQGRIKIEHTFGIFKNRFRSMQLLPIKIRKAKDHRRAIGWIMACIVLHNFCQYQNEDTSLYQPQIQHNVGHDEEIDEVDEELTLLAERNAGNIWRDEMRQYLFANQMH